MNTDVGQTGETNIIQLLETLLRNRIEDNRDNRNTATFNEGTRIVRHLGELLRSALEDDDALRDAAASHDVETFSNDLQVPHAASSTIDPLLLGQENPNMEIPEGQMLGEASNSQLGYPSTDNYGEYGSDAFGCLFE